MIDGRIHSQHVGGRNSLSGNTPSDDTLRLSARLAHPTAADPDLQRVVEAWPTLPPALRRAVLALVESNS